MFKKLVCLLILMAFSGAAQALIWDGSAYTLEEWSDDFDHAMMDDWARINYQGWYEQNVLVPNGYPNTYPGGPWTIGYWDGYQSLPDPDVETGISPTIDAENYVDTFNSGMGEDGTIPAWMPGTEGEVANGVLRMHSSNSGWADTWNTGPFLFKMVEGDFVAEVEVVARDYFWNNLGGLMARAPNNQITVDGKSTAVSAPGANENWVYLTHFPVYGVGNHIRDTINGGSTEMGIKGYPCDPFLQLSRVGNTFFFKTSTDGVTWISLPGLEAGVVRDDLPSELQVGIFQANYTGDWKGTFDFDNFSLVPEPATIALLGLGGLVLLRRRK